jgi:hypothetical protein
MNSIVSFVISFIVFKKDVDFYSFILTTFWINSIHDKLNIYEAKEEVKRSMNIENKEIKTVLEDCLFLLSLGVLFVLLGAIVETAAILG